MSLLRIGAPWRIPVATAQPGIVEVSHYTDAACPWAYNFEPALRALEARYGDQLTYRTVMIGLSETQHEYIARGYTAEGSSLSRRRFRRRGMPMSTGPRVRPFGTGRACRLVKAAELQGVPQAEALLRALRFAWFTTDLLMDEDDTLREVAESVDGLDAARALTDLESPAVEDAYQADRAEARSPTRFSVMLGRTAATDGADRYTAPSLVLRSGGRELVSPGFQPFEVADVLVMNLAPQLERLPVPDLPDLLAAYPGGLTTAEVARVLANTTTDPDSDAAEDALIALSVAGGARRRPLGHDALWTAAEGDPSKG
jgi:predicted DsbA family dithiol-disulfide isomerase